MAFTEASSSGLTSGTTRVAIVVAPGANIRRIIRTLTVFNRDTVAATVILEYSKPAGTTDRVVARQTLSANETLIFNDVLVLDATNNTISVSLAGAVTTNELAWTSHYADVST